VKAVAHLHFQFRGSIASALVDFERLQGTLNVTFERKEFKLFQQFLHQVRNIPHSNQVLEYVNDFKT
jgi:hypothetical protein